MGRGRREGNGRKTKGAKGGKGEATAPAWGAGPAAGPPFGVPRGGHPFRLMRDSPSFSPESASRTSLTT